jgi:hypothetical protein
MSGVIFPVQKGDSGFHTPFSDAVVVHFLALLLYGAAKCKNHPVYWFNLSPSHLDGSLSLEQQRMP